MENLYCPSNKSSSKAFKEGWDRIWGDKKPNDKKDEGNRNENDKSNT
jgi:hypothetical protein